jgi:PAS domain-containing protein
MSADWSTMQALNGGDLVASSHGPLSDWAWLEQNLPHDEHDRVRQAISGAIARKGLFEMEHRVLRPDGSTGWVRSRAVPILDESQVLVAWFGVASDITDRKHAQERLRLAIAGSDLGTWHWDLRTGGLEWSERCLNIFGLPARTAMSYEKFLDALHPEDRDSADDAVQGALQNGSEYRMNCAACGPMAACIGRSRWAALTTTQLARPLAWKASPWTSPSAGKPRSRCMKPSGTTGPWQKPLRRSPTACPPTGRRC